MDSSTQVDRDRELAEQLERMAAEYRSAGCPATAAQIEERAAKARARVEAAETKAANDE